MFIKAADIEAKVQPRPSTLEKHLSVGKKFIIMFLSSHSAGLYKCLSDVSLKFLK